MNKLANKEETKSVRNACMHMFRWKLYLSSGSPISLFPNPALSQKTCQMAPLPLEMLKTTPTGYLNSLLETAMWLSVTFPSHLSGG